MNRFVKILDTPAKLLMFRRKLRQAQIFRKPKKKSEQTSRNTTKTFFVHNPFLFKIDLIAMGRTFCRITRRCSGMQIFYSLCHEDRRTEVTWAQHALFSTWPFEDAERALFSSIDTTCTWTSRARGSATSSFKWCVNHTALHKQNNPLIGGVAKEQTEWNWIQSKTQLGNNKHLKFHANDIYSFTILIVACRTIYILPLLKKSNF